MNQYVHSAEKIVSKTLTDIFVKQLLCGRELLYMDTLLLI